MNKSGLSSQILEIYPEGKIQEYENGKYYLTGVLPDGFVVELMPDHKNLFVIRFKDFQFFAKKELERYFRHNLRCPAGYQFEVNSESIYVYSLAQSTNEDDGFRAFKQIQFDIDFTIQKLLLVIS